MIGANDSYAAEYAYKNDIFFYISGNDVRENEVMSIADVAKMKKATEKIKPMLSLNTLILGGTGTGKSPGRITLG